MTAQTRDDQKTERQVAELLAAALAAGASTAVLAALLLRLPRSTAAVVKAVVKVSYLHVRVRRDRSRTTARAATRADMPRYSAWYLINAAKRVQHGVDGGATLPEALRAERRWARLHVQMQMRRRKVAQQVDDTHAAVGGQLLGWVAMDDSRTSPDCRAAGGHNFDPTRPPVIGYPGSVHPQCRCFAGPPYPGAKTVDQALAGRTLEG